MTRTVGLARAAGEAEALTDPGSYEEDCYTCGHDDLGLMCCAECGKELTKRAEKGERFCADCAVKSIREEVRRILAGA